MKFVKGIGLFFIYPLTMLAIGFYAGVETYQFFYPGAQGRSGSQVREDAPLRSGQESLKEGEDPSLGDDYDDYVSAALEEPEDDAAADRLSQDALSVVSSSETLYVGTEYVLEETDILNKTVVETSWKLPDKYVGMNREQFLEAMKVYELSPPLSELERGFVGLEVLSFSRERVVVQMNYRYVQPSGSFYLAVYDNKVIVYLEDQMTVFIETEIDLDSLPEDLQQEIIQMMFVEDEETLYNFLESYSS